MIENSKTENGKKKCINCKKSSLQRKDIYGFYKLRHLTQ